MPSKKAPGAPPTFVLWREVLAAYAMPAVTAGLGGAVTRQPQLVVAALTTIGGTSALVAAALGATLRRRPVRTRPARTPRAVAAAALGLITAALGLAVGLAAARWLPQVPALTDSPWPRRLPVDLPVSSAIAATVTTWRWRGSRPTRAPQQQITQITPSLQPERQTS
ncbi:MULTISPECIES: hypothetical protein [unclassified Streptomyces]|uniref:hypothetical protein n=1 Tax=unclassified Streptomyces TaxID=2593676 RepID=UPI002E0FAD41|nr:MULTISPECIES: hypothetical protein [unclassified Streptomyces]WSR23224.1 hypothetical protein OG573_31565 [Streptomyces sp. NBC_01205]